MNKKFWRMLPALLLVLILVFSLAACQERDEVTPEEPPATPPVVSGDGPVFANPLDLPTSPGRAPTRLAAFSERARELHGINPDTVGWLYVPNTSLDDVVMWYPGTPENPDRNVFYLRRDFYRRYSWEGMYFADFRTQWGDFLRENISRNIVIYGHSMEDDPDGPLFSQFKRWQDEEWARNNPHVFFSTLEEDMVWEIFSVKFTNWYVPYNTPNPDDELFQFIIDDAKARSLWIYDIEVTIEDTIITFSTCTYNIVPTFPNIYRYVVMARLVERNATLEETASLTRNPNPVDARQRP